MGEAAVHRETHPRRVAICTLGCRLNQSESGLLAERLRGAGYAIVPFGEDADLGIVNTCTVTREADAKSRKLIKGFIRRNPDAYTAVIGCYSQTGCDALAAIPGVDLIVGNQEKLNLLHYVEQGRNPEPLIIRDRIDRDDFIIETGGDTALTTRANLKIQDGCNFMCSFCIIPFARGRARSRDLDNLVAEARQLAARGVQEVVLTGVNIGTYTHEGRTVLDVVDALNAVPGLARIRISSIEPTTIPEALFERMAASNHALVPYLHIPLQSGSDAILKIMKRRHTRADFCDFIDEAAQRIPDVCIGTDVMVGFPGESNADFEATLDVIANGPVAYAHVFKYSEREGTPAARRPEKVNSKTAAARSAAIRRESARKRLAFNRAYVGRSVEVLFEEQDADGAWLGYTGNYIRVAVRSNTNDDDLTNELRTIAIDRACGDFVWGMLNDEHH